VTVDCGTRTAAAAVSCRRRALHQVDVITTRWCWTAPRGYVAGCVVITSSLLVTMMMMMMQRLVLVDCDSRRRHCLQLRATEEFSGLRRDDVRRRQRSTQIYMYHTHTPATSTSCPVACNAIQAGHGLLDFRKLRMKTVSMRTEGRGGVRFKVWLRHLSPSHSLAMAGTAVTAYYSGTRIIGYLTWRKIQTVHARPGKYQVTWRAAAVCQSLRRDGWTVGLVAWPH